MGEHLLQNYPETAARTIQAVPGLTNNATYGSHTALPAPFHLAQLMVRSFLDETVEHAGYKEACSIFQNCGRMAGEEFTFCYLDLQHPPDQFFSTFTGLQSAAGLLPWQISYTGQGAATSFYFQPTWHCHGQNHKKTTLMCEYMGGFVLGLLDTYTNQRHTLIKCCRSAACLQGGANGRQCCLQALPAQPQDT